MIECGSCHATVKPTKKITWWVVGLLLILFWPGAILYVLTRPANTCPICGSRIQVPRAGNPSVGNPRVEAEAEHPVDERFGKLRAKFGLEGRKGRIWLTAMGVSSALLGVLVIFVVVMQLLPESEAAQADRLKREAQQDADRHKGFHCLSAWDGNHAGLERLVRDQLTDPGSMETHTTRISPADAYGDHFIVIDFSSKNAFGGRVRFEASGFVDSETCKARLITIE